MNMQRAKNRLTLGAAIVVAGALGLITAGGVGTAISQPRELSSWMTNDSGQTYGSLLDSASPDREPELIQAWATNGESGYVYGSDLAEANGSNVRSPEEAIKWQEENAQRGPASIPVYEVDGKTVIGEFLIYPGKGELVEPPKD